MKLKEAKELICTLGRIYHGVAVKSGKVAPEYHVLPKSEELAVGMMAYERMAGKLGLPAYDIAAQVVTAHAMGAR